MTYKEYKEQKIKNTAPTKQTVEIPEHSWNRLKTIKINDTEGADTFDGARTITLAACELSRENYLVLKEIVADYENMVYSHAAEFPFTKEDYGAFERNFENALGDLMYKDEDNPESQLDEIENMMNAVDWEWASHCNRDNKTHTPTQNDMIDLIHNHFETCMNSGCPEYTVSSGGFEVRISLFEEHLVSINFLGAEASSYDTL